MKAADIEYQEDGLLHSMDTSWQRLQTKQRKLQGFLQYTQVGPHLDRVAEPIRLIRFVGSPLIKTRHAPTQLKPPGARH